MLVLGIKSSEGRLDSALNHDPSLQPIYLFIHSFIHLLGGVTGSHCAVLTCLRTHHVDQGCLELRDLPASTSLVLGLNKGVRHHDLLCLIRGSHAVV